MISKESPQERRLMTSLFDDFKNDYVAHQAKNLSLQQYLELCKDEPMMYATAAERMVKAIGEPTIIDTSSDERLSRIFLNRKIRTYPDAFPDFYGMEDAIEQVASFFRYAAQGLEESKQVLYLLGPVASGKSSISEQLKKLMEKYPFYTLKAYNKQRDMWEISPIFESPLGLFDIDKYGDLFETKYNIPRRYLKVIMSPWATKRLEEAEGDLSKFQVVKLWPSVLKQIGITKVEPGDENNQDISSLVGKVSIRELDQYDQHDPDAYNWAGGLNVTTQGLMEFVEMFKAPIKMLHPMLTATQEGHYNGTEQFGAIPYQGILLAHCFTEDTELLTADGWKSIDTCSTTDVLATLNLETHMVQWQQATNKFVYYYDDEIHVFENDWIDFAVTPNHKMITFDDYSYNKVEAQKLNVDSCSLPVSCTSDMQMQASTVQLDYLRLLVWCANATSTIQKLYSTTFQFDLKNKKQYDRLTDLLEKTNIPYEATEIKNSKGIVNFNVQITGGNPLPKTKLMALSPFEVKTLLHEWCLASAPIGYQEDSTTLILGFEQTCYDYIDIIQIIAVTSGNICVNVKNYPGAISDVLVVKMDTKHIHGQTVNTKTVKYKGRVWCMETPNHTLIARRNGTVLITGNSNEAEWEKFRNNRDNEAFLDRVNIVKVPYCLRVTEERKIYEKLIRHSELSGAPCAPGTIEMMAQYSVLTRLKEPENSSLISKMEVYDGKSLKDKDPNAKSLDEYKSEAGVNEGMTGSSTRFAYKILSKVYNYDPAEIAANPIHLMNVLQKQIVHEQLPPDEETRRLSIIKGMLAPRYAEFLQDELQKAYLESYSEYGQNIFERYIQLADFWLQDNDFRDPDTGEIFDRDMLNEELEKIEKPAGVSNSKDFRNEVVNFVMRYRANNAGKSPAWDSYEPLRKVVETKMFTNSSELLPVISFNKKSSTDEQQKHDDFVQRMIDKGYTAKQTRLAVEWYLRYKRFN